MFIRNVTFIFTVMLLISSCRSKENRLTIEATSTDNFIVNSKRMTASELLDLLKGNNLPGEIKFTTHSKLVFPPEEVLKSFRKIREEGRAKIIWDVARNDFGPRKVKSIDEPIPQNPEDLKFIVKAFYISLAHEKSPERDDLLLDNPESYIPPRGELGVKNLSDHQRKYLKAGLKLIYEEMEEAKKMEALKKFIPFEADPLFY